MKRLILAPALLACSVATGLSGCGEIKNTFKPAANSADQITVVLDATPRYNQVGIFEAQAAGYFKDSDLNVHFVSSQNPLAEIKSGKAQIAVSNEPEVLQARNQHTALAAVGAILQGPSLQTVSCAPAPKQPKPKRGGPRPKPPAQNCKASASPAPSRFAKAPTYNAENFVVTESEIVNHAPVLRRFVQTVARGYAATKSNPAAAAHAIVSQNPGLNYSQQLAGVKATLPNFSAPASKPWGFQDTKAWKAFGTWLMKHKQLSNPNAITAADTNELLAGQGV